MKDIINAFKFTLKSIIVVAIVFSIGIGAILTTIGFGDRGHMILTLVLISLLFLIFWIYFLIVMCLYYKLPHFKRKPNTIGVLFYINTHGNKSDFNSFKEKFCERFDELSGKINKNNLELIILSQKNVSVIKEINKKEKQYALLKKTKCLFGVFIKSTDEGRESDEYQLQMNAMILHPGLQDELQKIFANNFNYIFNDLRISTLSKKNDLKNLQNLSTQLYYICQLIYAIANEYAGYFSGAIVLCNEILEKIDHGASKFYQQLSIILRCEICCCATLITNAQYNDFVLNDSYDKKMVENSLLLMKEPVSILNIPDYTINYHLAKAVYNLICNKLNEAKGEIALLDKKFSNIRPNARTWNYSNAFLFACANNPKQYWTIKRKYDALKHNNTQNPKLMFDFINTYQMHYPDNIGIKLSMIFIVYYKDLPHDIIPNDFRNELVSELITSGQNDMANCIKQINNKEI